MNFTIDRHNLYKEWSLVAIAFIICSTFLFAEWQLPSTHQETVKTGHAWLRQGYNFYKYGISNVVAKIRPISKNFKLYDKETSPPVFKTVSIYDPIFYSAFCALLWKFLGNASLLSLKIFNIILFSLLMIWLFRALTILFDDKSKAWFSSLGVLAFFPLLYTNISVPRDIHHYYFFVTFFYFILSYIFRNKGIVFLFLGALLAVFCLWVRPPLLSSFLVLSFLVFLWGYFEPTITKRSYNALSVFWLTSIFIFWIPFCTFNKITYDKYFLSALGENFLSSLYGVPYPDGDIQEHSVGKYVERKTGLTNVCATLEGDDLCLQMYKDLVRRYPLHPLKCMWVRFKTMLWYDLPWRESDPHSITKETSRFFKLNLAFSDPKIFLEFFARIYMRLLLILGYIGMIIAFYKKEYKVLIFMVFGVIFSSGYSWFFHIEDRVIAVHNWPFGLFAGYAFVCSYELLMSYRRKLIKKLFFVATKASV